MEFEILARKAEKISEIRSLLSSKIPISPARTCKWFDRKMQDSSTDYAKIRFLTEKAKVISFTKAKRFQLNNLKNKKEKLQIQSTRNSYDLQHFPNLSFKHFLPRDYRVFSAQITPSMQGNINKDVIDISNIYKQTF